MRMMDKYAQVLRLSNFKCISFNANYVSMKDGRLKGRIKKDQNIPTYLWGRKVIETEMKGIWELA